MDGPPVRRGMTLQVEVGDVAEARAFYTRLFGGPPDFAPHEDFLEWQVLTGVQLWWQVVGARTGPRPLPTRVRFLVDDVRSAATWLATETDIAASPVETLPGVVSYLDFEDPWGNRLGYYEDIVPSGAQPEPGGSVHDRSQFVTDGDG